MEQHTTFSSQGLELEGRLFSLASPKAAIITHPHPLYGGNMDNAVVETISNAYQKNGWSTLRFNFRGTGMSQGHFDEGIGEQKDVDAAIAVFADEGIRDIELAGYSYGAWVLACRAWKPASRHPVRLIAPPVAFIDFSRIIRIKHLKQVVVGTRDEYAPLCQVELLTAIWDSTAQFNMIQNADHFFQNHLAALQKALEDAIDSTN